MLMSAGPRGISTLAVPLAFAVSSNRVTLVILSSLQTGATVPVDFINS
jgi:hypothetical protein